MKQENIELLSIGALLLILFKKQQEPGVGKLEDYKFKRGGRIDAYWHRKLLQGEYTINPLRTIGRNINPFQDYQFEPELGVKQFGLHGIEFGNWMNQQDRLDAFFATMVSFRDLAKVLGVPMKKIGRNKLSVAFGARGRSGAKAHYEPRLTWTINLTKFNGKNSLAHEYGHFLDNYIGGRYYKMSFLSGSGMSKRPDPQILSRKKGYNIIWKNSFKSCTGRTTEHQQNSTKIKLNERHTSKVVLKFGHELLRPTFI